MDNIQPNDELTVDYAVITPDENWIGKFHCNCGTANCRGTITGKDWKISELQRRYYRHFHPAIDERIRAQSEKRE